MKMPIFLPNEMETEVFGTGHGFICINQKDGKKDTTIWLSVHQFSTILNHEKTLVREALSGKEGNE
jgi:hypothetical protein